VVTLEELRRLVHDGEVDTVALAFRTYRDG
jgi:hypothetical protein